MLNLSSKIEGLLFYKGEPVELDELAKMLHVKKDEVTEAILELKKNLEGRGFSLMEKDSSVALATSPELGDVITAIRKEELTKDLSKASLETLAVIIYKNGTTRADIDYIRGVNSSFILRNLLIRGLIEKITDPNDSRRYLYRPTFELLSFLGVADVSKMPDFQSMTETLSNEMSSNIKASEDLLNEPTNNA